MESPKPKAVCALIFNQDNPDLMLGISRRNNNNVFGLIGGKVDAGETWEQAIVREVFEESGLVFTIEREVFSFLCRGDRDFDVVTFLGTVGKKLPDDYCSQLSDEGIVKWCTKAEMIAGPFGKYNLELFASLGLTID